jgi:hypothetical protein
MKKALEELVKALERNSFLIFSIGYAFECLGCIGAFEDTELLS